MDENAKEVISRLDSLAKEWSYHTRLMQAIQRCIPLFIVIIFLSSSQPWAFLVILFFCWCMFWLFFSHKCYYSRAYSKLIEIYGHGFMYENPFSQFLGLDKRMVINLVKNAKASLRGTGDAQSTIDPRSISTGS